MDADGSKLHATAGGPKVTVRLAIHGPGCTAHSVMTFARVDGNGNVVRFDYESKRVITVGCRRDGLDAKEIRR